MWSPRRRTRAPEDGSPPPHPRAGKRGRWRRFWPVVAITVAAVAVVWLALRDTSPVGHFGSARGYDSFMSAYQRAMRELPAPDATLDTRTSFGLVRMYRFDGANPTLAPLVLLPGRASASPIWADNLPSLLRLRTVYTVDLLGEPGASIQARPITDDADQARWLHEALAQLPEPAVNLLGLSSGGWTAMNLAIRHPEKVASLILLEPMLTFANLSLGVVVRSIPVSIRWAPDSFRNSFNSWTANGVPVEDVPVADMIAAGMEHYRLKLPALSRFSTTQLSSIDIPVLAVMAGASRVHDPAAAARVARETLRRGTVLTYEGASHAVNGEQPDRIASDVAAFLDR